MFNPINNGVIFSMMRAFSKIPVSIVECGFLSNDEDLKLLQTDDYQIKIVDGITDAINEYYSL